MVTNNRVGQQELHQSEDGSHPRMSRAQLVERIIELNPTASPEFLDEFNEDSLAHYLDHLCIREEPAIPWVRRNLVPAIVRREAAE